MLYDHKLETMAVQFALALRAGRPAQMPVMFFSQWLPFMMIVKQVQGESA